MLQGGNRLQSLSLLILAGTERDRVVIATFITVTVTDCGKVTNQTIECSFIKGSKT